MGWFVNWMHRLSRNFAVTAIFVGAAGVIDLVRFFFEWNERASHHPMVTGIVVLLLILVFVVIYLVRLCIASRRLNRLNAALPVLFQKTRHLCDHLSTDSLYGYRKQLENELNIYLRGVSPDLKVTDRMALRSLRDVRNFEQKIEPVATLVRLADRPSFSVVDQQSFIPRGIERLLKDLRKGITTLTHDASFVCSVKLYVLDGGGTRFVSLYDAATVDEHREAEEQTYLDSGKSLPAFVIERGARMSFDSLQDASECHASAFWPNRGMGHHVNSGILAPVAIQVSDPRNGGTRPNRRAIAVLQVDSKRVGAFSSVLEASSQLLAAAEGGQGHHDNPGTAIEHMVQCTADSLGVLFSSAQFVRDRFFWTKYRMLLHRARRFNHRELRAEFNALKETVSEQEKTIALKDKTINEISEDAVQKSADSEMEIGKLKEQVGRLETELAQFRSTAAVPTTRRRAGHRPKKNQGDPVESNEIQSDLSGPGRG